MKLVPYIEIIGGLYEGTKYKLLNPTGRWKIVTLPYGVLEPILFIEHKGFIFKEWIRERNIVFRPEITEYINDCN